MYNFNMTSQIRRRPSHSDEIWLANAEQHADDGEIVNMESRCRFSRRRPFDSRKRAVQSEVEKR